MHMYIKELYIDDFPVYRSGLIPSGRRICIVFDSGLTGCLFTKSLWDELQQKTGKDLSSLRSVKVDVPTVSGGASAVHSIGSDDGIDKVHNMFYVSPISLDWFDDDTIAPHIVVLGQAFLSLGELSVDIKFTRTLYSMDESKEELNLDNKNVNEIIIRRVNLGKIPIMIQSSNCYLEKTQSVMNKQLGECTYDVGGYFIINGKTQ